MPIFPATVLDRLLEPVSASPSSRSSLMETESLSSTDRKVPFSFYPLLYITPPQQRPPSPSSFSPSPYVVNYKRRNPVQNRFGGSESSVENPTSSCKSQQNIVSRNTAVGCEKQQSESATLVSTPELKSGQLIENSQGQLNVNLVEDESINLALARENRSGCEAVKISGHQAENEVFEIEIVREDQSENSASSEFPSHSGTKLISLTPKDKFTGANGGDRIDRSSGACTDGGDAAFSIGSVAIEEFFDAPDAPFDDSTASDDETFLSNSSTRSPLKPRQTMKLRLQAEVDRRVQAEKALAALQIQWNEIARRYSPPGLSLSTGSCQVDQLDGGQDGDLSQLLSEKLSIARFVAGAIASASVRAVKEEELDSFVTAKNREISRLRDKLQYYELVNHEMSQRNQEAIEITQRHRRRHRKRVRWALACLGAVVCVGSTGLLCYKLIPQERARNIGSG